jgi:hypothetical protein
MMPVSERTLHSGNRFFHIALRRISCWIEIRAFFAIAANQPSTAPNRYTVLIFLYSKYSVFGES